MGRIAKMKVTLEKGLRADFMKAYDNGENPAEVQKFILETTSTSNKEDYGWLGSAPNLSEWLDERQGHGLLEFEYEIPNKDFEATLFVDRNAVEDDQLGAIKTRIKDLAAKARIHPRKLFFNQVMIGETELCYDGSPFFATDHKDSDESGAQSNLVAGAGVSIANLKADFEKAEALMFAYKDDRGEPMNEGNMVLTVFCSEQLKSKFEELRTSSQIDSSDNSMKGRFDLVVSSRFTAKNEWYIANSEGTVKPIIKQNRRGIAFEALEANSESGFTSKLWKYGIDYRVGFGYGLWQKMVKIKN